MSMLINQILSTGTDSLIEISYINELRSDPQVWRTLLTLQSQPDIVGVLNCLKTRQYEYGHSSEYDVIRDIWLIKPTKGESIQSFDTRFNNKIRYWEADGRIVVDHNMLIYIYIQHIKTNFYSPAMANALEPYHRPPSTRAPYPDNFATFHQRLRSCITAVQLDSNSNNQSQNTIIDANAMEINSIIVKCNHCGKSGHNEKVCRKKIAETAASKISMTSNNAGKQNSSLKPAIPKTIEK